MLTPVESVLLGQFEAFDQAFAGQWEAFREYHEPQKDIAWVGCWNFSNSNTIYLSFQQGEWFMLCFYCISSFFFGLNCIPSQDEI